MAQGKLEFIDVFIIIRKDDHSYTLCTNTGMYCLALANKLQMKPEAVREIGLGGMLFSIGKKISPIM
jgi:HD-GYP domain-containing protein (c-di-GMP phosphodiesterase class II)